MEVKPIVTRRVYQEIIAQFVEMIRLDQIKTGEKLPAERIVAEMFHVSRPSVREALRAMETIGLIEVRAGGGAYVTDLNLAPFFNTFAPLFLKREGFELELLDLREMLEEKSVELTSENCTEECLAVLNDAMKQMYKAISDKNSKVGAEGDIAFHLGISRFSGNYVLQKAYEFVNSLLEISIEDGRSIILEDQEDAAILYKEHLEIFEAIKNKNPDLARERMTQHLGNVKVKYKSRLK